MVGWEADTLAAYIAAVKEDKVVPALEQEFFARAEQVTAGRGTRTAMLQ